MNVNKIWLFSTIISQNISNRTLALYFAFFNILPVESISMLKKIEWNFLNSSNSPAVIIISMKEFKVESRMCTEFNDYIFIWTMYYVLHRIIFIIMKNHSTRCTMSVCFTYEQHEMIFSERKQTYSQDIRNGESV